MFDVSSVNTPGFLLTMIMCTMLVATPRRLAFLPVFIIACYVTLGQVVVIGGAHFSMLRILISFGWIRIIVRRELAAVKINRLDFAFILFVLFSVITYVLLRRDTEALTNRLGFAYDTLGLYFMFRALIRDLDDCDRIFAMIALLMVPLAVAMLIEKSTGRNLFSMFGGVPEITMIRDGKLRAQGPFAHPILAGTFGATSIPYFLFLWLRGQKGHFIPLLGFIAGAVIIITPSSSGPLLATGAVACGYCLWVFRDSMRQVRWAFGATIIALHLVMKAPVWYLIGRIGEIIGGGGYHRSDLIDSAIGHIGEWYLLGTDYTRHWMPTGVSWSENHTDITNQYIRIGVDGGLISLILFIWVIVLCYKGLGIKLKQLSDLAPGPRLLIWSLGVALSSHLVSFLSVRYFDQMIVFWYLLLALIATLTPPGRQQLEEIPETWVWQRTAQAPSLGSWLSSSSFTQNTMLAQRVGHHAMKDPSSGPLPY